ncbi:MAG TPA: aconitase family protein, partial [Thermoplasmata archaeon]|nr:aconitase family protein [Thermoplasmata archaeon]
MTPADPLAVTDALEVGEERSIVYRLDRIPGVDRSRLASRPRTTRILVENLLRHAYHRSVEPSMVRALANGALEPEDVEFPFWPGRILLQDFTGIPVLVDLTAMRSAARQRGIPPERVNPLVPVDLVVDHSVQVDSFGSPRSRLINLDREYDRNSERYRLLRWSRDSFRELRIVPPGNGIVHQVNLEYFAPVVTL